VEYCEKFDERGTTTTARINQCDKKRMNNLLFKNGIKRFFILVIINEIFLLKPE